MSKKNKKIRNLCFCGGGIYGLAEVAALKELDNYKEYLDINKWVNQKVSIWMKK